MKTIAVLDETIVAFDEGHRLLLGHPTRDQLNNWVRNGIRGITLEFCKVGGRPVTSKEAHIRFLKKVNDPSFRVACESDEMNGVVPKRKPRLVRNEG